METQIRAFWNGMALTEENGFHVSGRTNWAPARPSGRKGPSLSVSGGPDGFSSVLARPEQSNRTIALTIEESPKSGVYTFTPAAEDSDIRVRLEFADEPFPEAQMQTLDLTSELCGVEVGDDIVIGLRKDTTESPGVKEIRGTVIKMTDSSGSVPDPSRQFVDPSESPIVSIVVDFSDQDIEDTDDVHLSPMLSHRLNPFGNSEGTIDVIGTSEPYEIRWEGASDTPALSVESVTVKPEIGRSWTVVNESLSDVQFSPLHGLTVAERIEQFESSFNRASGITISDDILRMFASAVDGQVPELNVTVQYESPKSDELQSKSGVLDSVQSVYYADPNRARHQIRFKDTTLYYLLVDPHADATSPVGVYSKAYNRHWDTDLGAVRRIEIAGLE